MITDQIESQNRRCGSGLGFIGVAATAFALVGCAKGPVCKALGNCGGDPVGTWAQRPLSEDTSGTYCQESLHSPPLTEYLQGQPTPTARNRVPESTNLDWCYNLVLTPTEMEPVKKHLYWWENLPYIGGLVTYDADGKYRIDFSREGRVSRHYSRTCLGQYGHAGTCAQFQEILHHANEGAKEYNSFECHDDTEKGGCNCSFNIGEANAQSGMYSLTGSTLTHFSGTPIAHFSQASVCVNGDTMQLSGLNNSFLWDRSGLRTIELVRVDCEDGKKGPGEEGVDCGLRCPRACM
jgi:hypothetical protein